MRIAYLHGLESKGFGKKNEWLRSNFNSVYDPVIDYTTSGVFSKLYKEVKDFKPTLIVGSSIGGRFAYHIGNLLSIDTILFNPALVSDNPKVTKIGIVNSVSGNNTHNVILGKNDKIVIPTDTIKFLKKNTKNYKIRVLGHEHRTPYSLFTNVIKNI